MSRRRRTQEKTRRAELKSAPAPPPSPAPEAPLRAAALLLLAAFLLPNLGALTCGFLLDDLPLIVESERVHSLRHLPEIWKSGYWPDRAGLTAYRPVTISLWAALWSLGRGRPVVFHAAGLLLGAVVVLLVYRFLLDLKIAPRTAFVAALLFALFPIHTEATTSVVGSAELLAAAFGLGSVLLYRRGRVLSALLLFALGVFSKESTAAVAALPALFPREQPRTRRDWLRDGGAALAVAAIIGAVLWARLAVSPTQPFVPPIDNPMALVDPFRRVVSALWVQCLYIWKTFVPITLSADYSYRQIPLVMDPDEARAAAGLVAAGGAAALAFFWKQARPALFCYAVLFSPTANILFPIGTMMGERLAYLPSIGLALLAGALLARTRRWREALIVIALLYGTRTWMRNRDWRTAEVFYSKLLETSPGSAKPHYFYGTLLASRGDDAAAVAAYDRAIAIFPAYAEAYNNRGNALARLSRNAEAIQSFRDCLRFDPGNIGVAMKLRQLEAGLSINPPRKSL